jgi:hypothetical protein
MKQTKTIYFLEWLSKKSRFSQKALLEAMKPENQRWSEKDLYYYSIEDFIKFFNKKDWVKSIFVWNDNILICDADFWNNIDVHWLDLLLYSKDVKIEFSRYPIKNFEFVKREEKLKTKIITL